MNEANPKVIGAFVIGGVSLVVAALLLFSSQDFFTPKRVFVAYFQQSVNGLNVGAPVRFRGIPIGEVLEITGVFNPETGNMIPRLLLEIRPETMENAVVEEGEYTLFPLLVKNGMRASLRSSSFLTGQLYVALDFHPGTRVRHLGSDDEQYPEMPTIDSGFSEALEKLSDLPIEEVLARVSSTLTAAEELLRDPNFKQALAALPTLLADADSALVELNRFVHHDLVAVVNEASQTLTTTRGSLKMLTTTLTDESLVQVNSTLIEFEKTLRLAQKRLSKNDPLTFELLGALREVGDAARSIRDLTDYLDEHPESLIRGKSPQ